MSKIVINGDYLAFDTFAGVSRFATELLYALDEMLNELDVEILTPQYVKVMPKFKNIKIIKYGSHSILRWKNTDLPKYVRQQKALLVDLTQAFPLKVHGITCVHDCIPELVSSAYSGFVGKFIKKPLKLLQRRLAVKQSIAVLTVSEYSKKDIIQLFKIAPQKVIVISNAWQHIKKTDYDEKILKKNPILLEKEFYFTLGSRVPHKNLNWIIAAAQQNMQDIFVVSGENKYSRDFDKSKFPPNIIFTGYISDGEIRSLMKKCKAFILPSTYEGFGIPPMEALAEGSEIIISNISCLPSIYEKSAHYIDPLKYDNIDLDAILKTPVEPAEKILKKYSWENSAEILYKLLLKLNI